MSLHSSRSPSPDYTVGIRGRSTRGGPFHPGSSRRPSPFPGDPRVDHHRPLDAAHQVWQGPFRAVRTINKVSVSSSHLILLTVKAVRSSRRYERRLVCQGAPTSSVLCFPEAVSSCPAFDVIPPAFYLSSASPATFQGPL